jgi:hypothetical protein
VKTLNDIDQDNRTGDAFVNLLLGIFSGKYDPTNVCEVLRRYEEPPPQGHRERGEMLSTLLRRSRRQYDEVRLV